MDREGGYKERMRKFSLHFLILSPFPLRFLFISSFSLAFIKLHKTRFLGPFGIPTQTFTFLISPITISFSSKTKHQAKLSVTGQYYCRDQTVTERPVRPRVSAPVIV